MALSNPHLIASWAVAVAEALDARGLDSRALFEEAGIDIKTTRDPRNRIQADQMNKVYRLIDKTTGDPSFGLEIARHVHPTTFHALGYSLFASRTIESFCNRLVRYFRLVTTNAVTEFTRNGSEYRLTLNPTVGRDSYIPQDAWLATIIKFARDVYRPDFNPARVNLRRPDPAAAAQRFVDYFGAPVEFGCRLNALFFDSHDIHTELPAANAELARQNDEVVMSLLAQLDRSDILAQVRASFVDLLPSGECSKDKVAKRMNMSERTLQHKLNDRRTSYRELLNETRQEFAVQYLSQQVHSISEVAYLLGFSEISSFSRAFRAWVGQSPSEYRERRLRGD
ncbi:MAG: AraC family transcriptional regulator [Candidatus Tectomicrobia bacterium]|nr:AraC family transcriptional regulator [Candidatus Tectomicrobia bacterium]